MHPFLSNDLKTRLRQGDNLLGQLIWLQDATSVEIAASCGFDFVVIDREHVGADESQIVAHIRAAQGCGIAPVVRPLHGSASLILQALDAGAQGVQLPNIDTLAQAKQVVEAAKYAPLGTRGFASFQRSAGWGAMAPADYIALANSSTLVICQCESKTGADNIEAICDVKEIDVIFVGPHDLSLSLGYPGQTDHPVVRETIERIIRVTRDAGKAAGIFCASGEAARDWHARGAQYVICGTDTQMLKLAATEQIERGRA